MAIAEALKSSKGASIFLLTNSNLQKWCIDSTNEQVRILVFIAFINTCHLHVIVLVQLMYDAELVALIKEAVIQEEWVEITTPTDQISMWLMDMQLCVKFAIVLFAIRCDGKPTVEHGLGE